MQICSLTDRTQGLLGPSVRGVWDLIYGFVRDSWLQIPIYDFLDTKPQLSSERQYHLHDDGMKACLTCYNLYSLSQLSALPPLTPTRQPPFTFLYFQKLKATMSSAAPPPDGDHNRAPLLLTIAAVTFVAALSSVIARIYTRLRISHAFGWDDYTIVAAMVVY